MNLKQLRVPGITISKDRRHFFLEVEEFQFHYGNRLIVIHYY